MSLLESFGAGLQNAGEVLSPQVYEKNAIERREQAANALPNLMRSLQIHKIKGELDADQAWQEYAKDKVTPGMDSSAMLGILKDRPDLLSKSPAAQQYFQLAGQLQQREAAQEARQQQIRLAYERLDQQRELAEQRAADARLSAEERARANLANEQIRTQMLRIHEEAQRQGFELRRDLLRFRTEQTGKKEEGKLTPDAVTNEAWYQIINGKIRPGAVSWGVSGNPDRAAITNKMAEIANDYGIPPDKLASLGLTNRAKASALLALEKQRNAVQAYERSFISQVDVLEGLSQKVGRTGSPWLNTPINELRSKGAGDPDVAEYLGQMRLVTTEAARIIANPNLVGQLTDTARKEIHDILNGSMTVAQVTRLTTRLKADAELRKKGLDDQAEKLGSEIRGSAETAPKTDSGKAVNWSDLK